MSQLFQPASTNFYLTYTDNNTSDEYTAMTILVTSATVAVLILLCGLIYINRSFATEPLDIW